MPRFLKFCLLILSLVSITLLISGCDSQDKTQGNAQSVAQEVILQQIDAARVPYLFKDTEGEVWLSYVIQANTTSTLWLRHWQNSNWSEPQEVASGDDWFVNWADFPSVVKNKDRLMAHWLQKNGEGTYAYGVQYAVKELGGEWQNMGPLHTDNSPTEHGFVSLQPDQDRIHAIWLDGRNMLAGHGHAAPDSKLDEESHQEKPQGMSLRYATLDAENKITQRIELDELTCDCCQTSTAMSENGLVIAYRDREILTSDSEIRDIKVLRQLGNTWVASSALATDQWDLKACPVNGPDLAANKAQLALAWFTAANNQSAVKIAFSNNNGESFLPPYVVATKGSLGRVGVDWLNQEQAVISWIGQYQGQSHFLFRVIARDGSMEAIKSVSQIDMSRASGVPQFKVLDNKRILFVWTESGDSPSIQSKVVNW
ncbi:MAG: hypothetical protein HKN88_04420 [Gammaproteobacteria bacterium]|nr:hypothetical protein [Gammaproteobacteria bacterium]NNC97297.1 hypothetical protein [Gammaproteobacteria bacterium]NNM14679.1 hypothetical protein [Gammaproteobacteria bacterium]